MAQHLTVLASLIAVVALVGCAVSDLRHRRIPNVLVVILIGARFFHALTAGLPSSALGAAVAVAIAAFAVGAACFAMGWLGGGDVKLAAAVLLWAGPSLAPLVLTITGAVGILVALAGLLVQRVEMARTAALPGPLAVWSTRRGVPYGIGLASAGLLVVLSQFRGG